MPVFTYTAIDQEARELTGVIQAENPRRARSMLLQQGLRPSDIHLFNQRESSVFDWKKWWRRYRALRERPAVLEALENLHTLLESQLSLEAAWDAIVERHTKAAVPSILLTLHDGIRSGTSLSTLLRRYPDHFDSIDTAIIQAGEASGELNAAILRLVLRRQMRSKLQTSIVGTLAYPAFLMILAICVVILLSTTVIPNLNNLLVAGGSQVPLPTRILVSAGRFLSVGLLPVSLIVLLITGFVVTAKPALRAFFTEKVSYIPLVSQIMMRWQLAQLCFLLQTLLSSGVNLAESLHLAAESLGTGRVKTAVMALHDRILHGHDLSGHLPGQAESIPLWLWRALAVGQAAGNLVPILERAGQRFESLVNRDITRLSAVLEPAMILMLGGMIGFVAYAALLPIVKLGGLL